MKRLTHFLIALAMLAPIAAQAQLYGVSLDGYRSSNPGPSLLYEIDPVTGAGTLIGNIGYAVNSIAVDPTTGTLYASTTAWSGEFNGLLVINTSTGAGTEVGEFGDEYEAILGLSFDSSGQLWGWHDPNEDDPVRIDKATGAATTVGESGLSTGGHVLAFSPQDEFLLFQGEDVYIINQATGLATFVGWTGVYAGQGGGDMIQTGAFSTLWAPRESGRSQNSFIRVSRFDSPDYLDIDTDVEYLNALTWGPETLDAPLGEPTELANFRVTKEFSDGRDDEVEVTLTCNGGLPLVQSLDITGGGDGVLFVLENIPAEGVDCEVSETGGPAGYTSALNFGAGCRFEGVVGGEYTCTIVNWLEAVPYEIEKVWEYDFEDTGIPEVAFIETTCENVRFGGASTVGTITFYDSLSKDIDLGMATYWVYPNWTDPATRCRTLEDPVDSAVESDQGCYDWRTLEPGDGASCTIVNTVIFEGIPTLSQWGLYLMALLMLGVGFVGLRRFV